MASIQGVGQAADAVDMADDLVAGVDVDGAFGRAGQDDVAGAQVVVPRQVADDFHTAPHHVIQRRVLTHRAIDLQMDTLRPGRTEIRRLGDRGDHRAVFEILAEIPGPPGFLGIGILAVLLGVTMWLTFKLNPSAMDPVQQQIFNFMPWILMFVMAPFAAGLLLYWVTSNILTLAQQKYLYSQHPQLRAQAEKDKAEQERAKAREGK